MSNYELKKTIRISDAFNENLREVLSFMDYLSSELSIGLGDIAEQLFDPCITDTQEEYLSDYNDNHWFIEVNYEKK